VRVPQEKNQQELEKRGERDPRGGKKQHSLGRKKRRGMAWRGNAENNKKRKGKMGVTGLGRKAKGGLL